MFEHRLEEIGDTLWSAFSRILSSEPIDSPAFEIHAFEFFREALKPERNLKNDDLLNFLKSNLIVMNGL